MTNTANYSSRIDSNTRRHGSSLDSCTLATVTGCDFSFPHQKGQDATDRKEVRTNNADEGVI